MVAANLRALEPDTLETLNTCLVTGAAARAIEPGRTVRIDSTVVPMAIHAPTDSALLYDGVRVLLRLLRRAEHLALLRKLQLAGSASCAAEGRR